MDDTVDFDMVRTKIAKLKSDRADYADKVEQLQSQTRETQDKLGAETSARELLERKVQQLEGDAFATQAALEETIKQLQQKLEVEENKTAELEREVNKLRMENEKVEKSLVDMDQKYKNLVDSLGSAMADLNNV